MRFDDDASKPSSDPAGAGEPGARARRRSARPWSTPAPSPTTGERARPLTDPDWGTKGPPIAGPRLPLAPPRLDDLDPNPSPPASAAVDLAPILDQLTALQAQVTDLQTAVTAPPPAPDAALVTGAELAAAIESLGTVLGGGMATLLTEHRNLLARDVNSAADRILEELGVRLRAASTQTVDAVEERSRHVVTRALGELTEQVDLRLDKLQADVTGLRAVMLAIPDQTAVTDRLDQLAETLSSGRLKDGGRVSPALVAAVEKSVASSLEEFDERIHAVVDGVRELLDDRLPGDLTDAFDGVRSAGHDDGGEAGGGPRIDAATLEALTKEMAALRRRISLRASGTGDDVDLDALAERVAPRLAGSDTDDEDDDPIMQIPVQPAPSKVSGRRGRRTIS